MGNVRPRSESSTLDVGSLFDEHFDYLWGTGRDPHPGDRRRSHNPPQHRLLAPAPRAERVCCRREAPPPRKRSALSDPPSPLDPHDVELLRAETPADPTTRERVR